MTMDIFDVVIVGSGINSLVCAAMLVRRGKRVCVLERNAVAGGCIRTEEVTLPGFRHDLFSMSYPLFVMSPHYPVLKDGSRGPRPAVRGRPHADRRGSARRSVSRSVAVTR